MAEGCVKDNENVGSRLCSIYCEEDGFSAGLYGEYVPRVGEKLHFRSAVGGVERFYKVTDVTYVVDENKATETTGNMFISQIHIKVKRINKNRKV
ncbi:MAG: hypothetical protein HZB67_04350 [Candidatus Aenigmarchaeota archaeon]|nr:hypothetical protein [Candidatus Aenigmarchaeota archaeon]